MRHFILGSAVALGVLIPSVAKAQETCKPAVEATKLPAVSTVRDSASLIKNLPVPQAAAAKEVFVSVRTGPTARAVVLDSTVAKTDAGRVLADKVVASLKPNAKSVLPSFRLRVLLGEAPALAVLAACTQPGT